MKNFPDTQQLKQLRVLLIGESCYDVYHLGTVTRVSPEAPIPIFDLSNSYTKYGMASNVYDNLVNLGIETHLITKFLENKHRYIDSKSRQQVLRVDEKCNREIDLEDDIVDQLDNLELNNYDALVISDYDKGYISYEIIEKLNNEYHGPIFIDTKKTDLARFQGCVVKINEIEYSKITSYCDSLIVTYGGEKVIYGKDVYTPPKVEVHDVCGAGDTFIAALAFGYLRTNDMRQAILFAMKAAAITVQHIGVYAPTLEQIELKDYSK